MTGFDAIRRRYRKPALALLAAAGLVAWAGVAPAPVEAAPADRPTASALTEAGRFHAPALGQSGLASAGLLAETPPQRQGPRGDSRSGTGGPDHSAASTAAQSLILAGRGRLRQTTPRRAGPPARAGREAAPSTGPPSFPF